MGNYKIEKELKVKYDIYPSFKYRARGVAHEREEKTNIDHVIELKKVGGELFILYCNLPLNQRDIY
jgi:hypothetical protein